MKNLFTAFLISSSLVTLANAQTGTETQPVSDSTENFAASFFPGGSKLELDRERFLSMPNQDVENHIPINRERGDAQPVGALTGASIFLSPGHGWFVNGRDEWGTQRGNSYGVVEDHSNGETVLQYLVPYLWNAGANVYVVRERDMQTNEVIVETPETTGKSLEEPHESARNRTHIVAKTGTEPFSARFTPDIPEAGYYAVTVWYNPTKLGETSTNTTFQINHTGGKTNWVQNQNRDFGSWKYIGHYYFEEGKNPDIGSVVVTNNTGTEDEYVVVDAVRFGGGVGSYVDDRTGSASGKPRWEESGFYHAQYLGFNPEFTGADRRWNTVHAMPRYAEWEMEEWERGRSVYLSWHTNASLSHEISGISTYIYGVDAWDSVENFSGYPGSPQLAYFVHNQVLQNVRNGWDENWEDVGIITRWLGETNPYSNSFMPSMLLENGFHDNPDDAAYILEPDFRKLSARAAYVGLVKYYNHAVDGFDITTIAPDPPTHFSAQTIDSGSVTLSWEAPQVDSGDELRGDAADHYRLYTSKNGYGFDNGIIVEETSFTINGLPTSQPTFFRVAAVNQGGESWVTETLAVQPKVDMGPKFLIINGFDRLDSGLNITESTGGRRGILSLMNTFNYTIQPAEALSDLGYGCSSSSNEAVESGDTNLTDYDLVLWQLGNENKESELFTDQEAQLLVQYIKTGGRLILSGSNVISGLDATKKLHRDLALLLGAGTNENFDTDANSNQIFSTENPMGAMIETGFSDGTAGFYPALDPDVLIPIDGYSSLLTYDSSISQSAAVGNDSIVVMGVPFETLEGSESRRMILSLLINSLDI